MIKTRRISKTVWGIILVCAVIGAFLLVGCNSLPVVSSLFATDTPTATITFTPTATPTVTPTSTPRPTPTATPDQRVLNPANQHLYLYVRIPKTWHGAKDYCASLGGHLVTIQAPSENKFVYDLATDNTIKLGTWLGATDEEKEGTWVWVTGEPWNYSNWIRESVQPQPDNKAGNPSNISSSDAIRGADYLIFDFWDKTWADWSNEDNWYFVCEWESATP